MFSTKLSTAVAFSILCPWAVAQGTPVVPPVSEFLNITTFPNEQYNNVTRYLHQAETLAMANPRIYQFFQDLCITNQATLALFGVKYGYVKPFSPFDNLMFVGHTGVSSWAYDTGAGLTVIDALNNANEVQAVMLPRLESFGYQGSDIKNLIITHEHGDHYGGAKYLQDNFNTTLYASATAWDAIMAVPANSTDTLLPPPPSTRGLDFEDGQDLSFGNITFHMVATPGHTSGCFSLIFPVFANGTAHMAGLSGGTGNPAGQTDREDKVRSQYKFGEVAKAKGVDVLVSNHQNADHAVQNAELIEYSTASDPNPFIIGTDSYVSYMQINAICTQVQAAREGMNLNV